MAKLKTTGGHGAHPAGYRCATPLRDQRGTWHAFGTKPNERNPAAHLTRSVPMAVFAGQVLEFCKL